MSTAPAPAAVTVALKDSAVKERKYYRVKLNRLALRETPDREAKVLRHLPSGTLVEALPQKPRGFWRAVDSDGVQGWVGAQWLVAEQ